jgi:hypothetical protein
MVAIPQWLKTQSDADQPFHHHREPASSEAPGRRPAETTDAEGSDIPIFCAGGCGEVVGYLRKEQKVLGYNGKGRWCPRCEAAAISRKRLAEEAKVSFTSTDELAGLVKQPRDLRWLRLVQAASVAVIIAGSACIAMGRVVGIYLAACGTVAWFVTCLIHWKMRD